MGCTVTEIEQQMGSRELTEWMAFDRINPIDSDLRNEMMGSIVASTVANCHRGKNTRPFKVSDFMPTWDVKQKKTDSLIRLRDYLKGMAKKK